MSSVVAVNPDYTAENAEKPKTSFFQKHSKPLKVIGSLAVLGVVGVAGFLIGSSTSSEASTTDSSATAVQDAATPSAFEQSRIVLGDKFQKGEIEVPEGFQSSYEEFCALCDSETELDETARELCNMCQDGKEDENNRSLETFRNLQSTNLNQLPYVSGAWELIESINWDGSDIIVEGIDRATVRRVNGNCYIVGQESNEAGDWFSNLNLGSADIEGFVSTSTRCCTRRWWWGSCRTYGTCSGVPTVGSGYKGFAQQYNRMSARLWARMQSTCRTSDTKIFTGFSRGAGLINQLVAAVNFHYKNGDLSSSWATARTKVVTFGSPRSLTDDTSDTLHSSGISHYRMIYRQDLVVSIPYGWMGFKHWGDAYCTGCSYANNAAGEVSRDRPGASWNIGHHTSYCQYFGDASC